MSALAHRTAVRADDDPIDRPATEPSPPWRSVTERYRTPSDREAWLHLAVTLVPIVLLWALMTTTVDGPLWLHLALATLAAGFFVRLFLIQHDCGHGSFFATPRWNDLVGAWICVPLLTPYLEWRRAHAIHHKNTSKLETRILPDIYTMTLSEWQAAGFWKRLGYRIFRSPLFLFGLAPSWHFFISNRIKGSMCPDFPRGKNLVNLHLSTLGYVAFAAGLSAVVGWEVFWRIQLPITLIGATFGIWIFYVQHQFEHTWWASRSSWNHLDAALKGSSFLDLPAVLRFFTLDVGYHHVHHLDPKIPGYRLKACHDQNPGLFAGVRPLTLRDALRATSLRLWDEQRQRLIPFP